MNEHKALCKAVHKAVGIKSIMADNGASFVCNVSAIVPEAEAEAALYKDEIIAEAEAEAAREAEAEAVKARIAALQAELKSLRPARSMSGNAPSRPIQQRSDWGPVLIDGEQFSSLSKACKTLRGDRYNRSALENFKWLVKTGLSVQFINTGRIVQSEHDYLEFMAE